MPGQNAIWRRRLLVSKAHSALLRGQARKYTLCQDGRVTCWSRGRRICRPFQGVRNLAWLLQPRFCGLHPWSRCRLRGGLSPDNPDIPLLLGCIAHKRDGVDHTGGILLACQGHLYNFTAQFDATFRLFCRQSPHAEDGLPRYTIEPNLRHWLIGLEYSGARPRRMEYLWRSTGAQYHATPEVGNRVDDPSWRRQCHAKEMRSLSVAALKYRCASAPA